MKSIGRRKLIRALGATVYVVASRIVRAAAEARLLLDEKDAVARAIGYVADAKTVDTAANPAYRRGQSCVTCAFIEFGSGRQRGCSLVPGKLVQAAGWCKVWKLRGSR